jgi:hypothetical protein
LGVSTAAKVPPVRHLSLIVEELAAVAVVEEEDRSTCKRCQAQAQNRNAFVTE